MSGEDEKQYKDAFEKTEKYGPNPITELTLLGDRSIRIQLVYLLSYIRNAIAENKKMDITVSIGKNIANGEFEFLVNNSKTDDLVAKEVVEIN